MDALSSLDLDQLLQLLIGIIGCAVILAVLIFGYLFFAWRKNRRLATVPVVADGIVGGVSSTSAVGLDHRLAVIAADSISGAAGSVDYEGGNVRHVDVNARLAGIGRDAWTFGVTESAKESLPLPGEEVLRLVVSDDGGWWVEVAGQRIRQWTDIRDRAVSDNVLRAITWCLRFTKGLVMTRQGIRSAKVPAAGTVPLPVALGGVSGAFSRDEIFRLRSDSVTDGFWVQVGDQCYASLVQVRRKEIGERILSGASRLLQFSQGRLVADSGLAWVAVPDLPDDAVPATDILPTLDVSPEVAQEQEKRLAQEQFIREMLEENQRLAKNAIERPRPSGRRESIPARASVSEQVGFDLVSDIDRIFQAKLAASSMAHVDAQIVAGPDGGVHIRVGAKHYGTPDEVPDGDLRQMIKAAIAEW